MVQPPAFVLRNCTMLSDATPGAVEPLIPTTCRPAERFVGWVKNFVRPKDAAQKRNAPVLSDPKRFPFGPFRFKIQISGWLPCTILCSADLINWTSLASEESKSQGYEYVDSEARSFSHRFYRVAVQGGGPLSNVIGYASTILPPGFSLIANPFQSSSTTVGEMFASWPEHTTFNKFDTVLLRLTENAVRHGKWTNPGQQLLPGEGAIFFNPTNDYKMHTFAGEVAPGTTTVPIPSGFSLRSSLFPKAGDLVECLNFPISDGDVVHLFDRDRQKYSLHSFQSGQWIPAAPLLSFGEAFWIAKGEPGNWMDGVKI
jgi:hypothetical protein